MEEYFTTIRRRKRGSKVEWTARLFYHDKVTGKRKEKSKSASTRSEANDYKQDLVDEYLKGGQTFIESRDMLFSDALDHILERRYKEARIEPTTGRALSGVRAPWLYKIHVNHFKSFFGNMRIRDIKVQHIEDYRENRLDSDTKKKDPLTGEYIKINVATVDRELNTLRAILHRAEINDWILVNPFNKVERGELITVSEETPPEFVVLPKEEWRLLDAAEADSRLFLGLVMCALDTGGRRGELLHRLRWPMVDFEAGVIRDVTSFKGGRGKWRFRTVPMTSRLKRILLEVREATGELEEDSVVFNSCITNFRKRWETIRKNAKALHVTFHVMRHTFCTRLGADKEELGVVGKMMGHSNPKTTWRYLNPTDEQITNAGNKLDQFHAAHSRPVGEPALVNPNRKESTSDKSCVTIERNVGREMKSA